MNMRMTLCVVLAAILALGAPWRAALADDGPGASSVDVAGIERYGRFSHVPEPYATDDTLVCPECAELRADAGGGGGGGGTSSASTWLVIALIVIVVVAASSSDSGDGGGY
jgi:hypothetical protein